MPRIFRYLEGNEKYIHNIDAAADRKESKKEMKSYQHSNKSESLKGVAGLNCESRFLFSFSLDSARLLLFFSPLLPIRWMDGCIENVCMHTRIRTVLHSQHIFLSQKMLILLYSL